MVDTAALLCAAMLLDAALGEPRWLWSRLPHPAVLMGRAISALDRAWNRGTARRARGVAAMVALGLGALALGAVLELGGPAVEIVAAAILLAQRALVDHVRAVADGLRGDLQGGRAAVAMIVSRDTAAMDEPAVARAAIESAAENLSDGVIAPAFWFLVGGLPGLLLYKMTNTADSMIGYRTPRHADFGWAAARFDDLLNLVPARLTAGLIALATGGLGRWHRIAEDARAHLSPNAGWPEAAMARALNIALAGPRVYDGRLRDLHWVHEQGRRSAGAADIDAAITRLWRAWACAFALTAALAISWAAPILQRLI
ncbi:MAG: adenosylcobinamide-phosphate synthase CbiB [Rhodobacteraceae bacterium]|nr:adenosylcobinamide-phosphate synthase CbiB [Paracoccaceae bacterium]